MKKKYSKPEIVFENFAMSTSIAAGCDIDHGLHVKDACGYEFGRDGVIFTDEQYGCQYEKPDGFNGICYHNPTEDSVLFNS